MIGLRFQRNRDNQPHTVKSIDAAVKYMVNRGWKDCVITWPEEWYQIDTEKNIFFKHTHIEGKYTGILAFSVTLLFSLRTRNSEGEALELRLKTDYGYMPDTQGHRFFDTVKKRSDDLEYCADMALFVDANGFLRHQQTLEALTRQASGKIAIMHEQLKSPIIRDSAHATQVLQMSGRLFEGFAYRQLQPK